MQSFIIACAVAIIVAVGSVYVLNTFQEPVAVAFASPTGVRL